MYSRGRTYGRLADNASSIPKFWHAIISGSPCARNPPTRRNHLAYQGVSLRHSHATAVGREDEGQQDSESVHAIRRIRSNNPHTTPSLRFITFDQAQHDLGAESRESWERERYSDQIATFLPMQSASQPKEKEARKASYGKNKKDKLFVNKLLMDKGMESQNWRIAFSDLLQHYEPKNINEAKKMETFDNAPSLVQIPDPQTQELDSSNENPTRIRSVTSMSRNYISFRLARSISPPTEWSEANLAVYVEALAESQKTQAGVPWAQKPQVKGWSNIEDVVAAFDTVFYSTALQKYLSIEACNTALRFFYDYGMMPKARSLYIHMEDLKMHIPTKTFNVLLRGSASRRDLHNFTFLLNNMIRRGFKPNEETWTLFLQVIESSSVRAVIVRKMAEMNMLEQTKIRRDVAACMVNHEIVNHLGHGHDHHSVLGHMTSKYGNGWLSTTAGNELLDEVAKRKSTAESLSLLYEMKQAGFEPNVVSMNTLLRHCLPLRQHELAIEILDTFDCLYRLLPGPEEYETLFLQAWRCRLLNFSTVIWRSACIYGDVSSKIRRLVFRSLLSYTRALDKRTQSDNTVQRSTSRSIKFKRFAARFVIGLDGPREAQLNQAMDNMESDPRRRTFIWAQVLLESSLRVSRNCLLKRDLPSLLRQALTMDRTWAAEGLHTKDDWREMLPHAIAVHVNVNRKTRTRSSTTLAENHSSKYRGRTSDDAHTTEDHLTERK